MNGHNMLNFGRKRSPEALSAITLFSMRAPIGAEKFIEDGVKQLKGGQLLDALNSFSRAVELEPKNTRAHVCMGITRAGLGDPKGAEEDLKRAMSIDPGCKSAYQNLGLVFAQCGRHISALGQYSKALDLDPKDHETYNNRGNSRAALGDHAGAINDYNAALLHDPNNARYYYNRALARKGLGLLKGAVADLQVATGLDAKFSEAWGLLRTLLAEAEKRAAQGC